MSLRDVAEHGQGVGAETLREYIECACSGVMACSTCHVILHPDSFHVVGAPDVAEEVGAQARAPGLRERRLRLCRGRASPPALCLSVLERVQSGQLTRGCRAQDMLDLAHGRCETSRLGCQLTLAAHMQGMVVCIPDGSNNLMDHIPFPDA